MKLIKPLFEILEQGKGIDGMFEHMETCGRTCYKSEPRYEYYDLSDRPNQPIECYRTKEGLIIPLEEAFEKGLIIRKSTSAKKFINEIIIPRGHTAMLEHGTVYLQYCCRYNDNPSSYGYDWDCECEITSFLEKYESNPYTNVVYDVDGYYACITTNYRVLLQNGWLDDLKYQCEPTEYHVKRVTVKFICDRGVSHEFVRHKTILCVA